MTARMDDINGFFEVKANPISKVGVFPYLGEQIALPGFVPGQVYNVLRPESELSDPATLESFKNKPWIDEHELLGEGGSAVEEKIPKGTIGEEVFFEGGSIKANLICWSDALRQQIESGKEELSCGYRCKYIPESGMFEGEEYDAIQTEIRGNHIATVQQGRMGPDIAVLDADYYRGLKVTHDQNLLSKVFVNRIEVEKDFIHMTDKKTSDEKNKDGTTDAKYVAPEVPAMDAANMQTTLDGLADVIKKMGEDMGAMHARMDEFGAAGEEKSASDLERMDEIGTRLEAIEGIGDAKDAEDPEKKTDDEDPDDKKADDMEEEEKASDGNKEAPGEKNEFGADAKIAQDAKIVSIVDKRVAAAMDERLPKMQADARQAEAIKTELVDQAAPFIGAFDHADKTVDEVAKHITEKIGIPVEDGYELAAARGWLHGRPTPTAADAVSGYTGARTDADTGMASAVAAYGKKGS